ncbi:hypothetical protein BOX15_Mlig000534g2 [Macrostomum lignano]|uniref:Uncharacterized protein n=2 Tax=Macrostomum lignano TaxID=282301 RepID=A0A267DTM1_9PLAT|nr:hypothetical protein BOX15_Mlig000534g2 [Macrostomum lignano]
MQKQQRQQQQQQQQPEESSHAPVSRRQSAYQQEQQPKQEWMPLPDSPGGYPPGLRYLMQVDQLIIKQQKEVMEILIGLDLPNQYVVLNTMGQPIYFANEKSSSVARNCCGAARPFELNITDSSGEEVIHVSRPYRCMCLHQGLSCLNCCKDLVTVEAPPGQLVGQVRQIHRRCEATYEILDSAGDKVLSIDGPNYCHCYCPGDDIPFSVRTHDGEEVGRVSRQWSNLMQEYFTDADNFGITFPIDLHLNVKATIIGACFLIDFMFFEKGGRMY